MSTVSAARYRRLAIHEPDKEKSRIFNYWQKWRSEAPCALSPTFLLDDETRQTNLQRSLVRNGT
jgi:hypothetical protein